MNDPTDRDVALKGIENADNQCCRWQPHVAPRHRASHYVRCHKEDAGTVTTAVTLHAGAVLALEQQPRHGTVKRREPEPLAEAQHHGTARFPCRPVARIMGRWLRRHCQRSPSPLIGCRRSAGRSDLVAQQTVDALIHEPRPPAPYGCLSHLRGSHHFGHADPGQAQQNDPGTPGMLLRRVPLGSDAFQRKAPAHLQRVPSTSAHTPYPRIHTDPPRPTHDDYVRAKQLAKTNSQ